MVARRDRLTAHCKRCDAVIAEWDGPDALTVGGAHIRLAGRRVVLDCPACGTPNRFFPRPEKSLDKTDAPDTQ
jgi:RNase P subunit RPR2